MPRCDGSEAAQASAANSIKRAAPLGFLHPDGSPVTLEDCALWSAKLRAENIERTKALKAIEQRGAAADLLEYVDLTDAARLGVLRLRAWSALAVLAREAVSLCEPS